MSCILSSLNYNFVTAQGSLADDLLHLKIAMRSVGLALALRSHFGGAREEDLIGHVDRLRCITDGLDVKFIEVVALEELLDAVTAKL